MTKASPGDDDDQPQPEGAPPVKKKRNRPTVSCAECRRLKLKCDRRVPCSSCSKRGCAALCPNGVLAAGPGNRFVLADTQQLHEKIEAMGRRITELEDALAKLAGPTHPLLAEELLLVKAPLSTQNTVATINDITENVSGSLGTLTLGERPHFFGPHAAVDYLVTEESADDSSAALPSNILLLAGAFPLTDVRSARSEAYLKLLTWLPPAQQAWALVEHYYAGAAWLFLLTPKEEFRTTVFARVYSCAGLEVPPHDLAVLLMTLATGALVDSNSADSAAAPPTTYYHLARVALGLDSVIDHPTLQAIRAIHMMSSFAQMANLPNSTTVCYSLIGLAARLCHTLGLHRDDTQWNLSADEQYRRRHVFWEVASFDSWSSLAFGRPPSFSTTCVDAKIAEDRSCFQGADGEWHASFYHWSHTFIQQVVLKLLEQAFGNAPVPYATVLRLDKLVRDHPTLKIPEDVDDPSLLLQRTAALALTQRLLLYLHRSYFAHALTSHPTDPLQSPFAQSVLAAFRSAAQIHSIVAQVANMGHRFWLFWSHAASAGLMLASIPVCAPGSGLAPPALSELDKLCEMMEGVAVGSERVSGMMPKLRRLRDRAHAAYDAFVGGNVGGNSHADGADEMELRFMWGETRLVDRGGSEQPSDSSGRNTMPPAALSGIGVALSSGSNAVTHPLASALPSMIPLDVFSSQQRPTAAFFYPHPQQNVAQQNLYLDPAFQLPERNLASMALLDHDVAWQRFVSEMGLGGQDQEQHQQQQHGFTMSQ